MRTLTVVIAAAGIAALGPAAATGARADDDVAAGDDAQAATATQVAGTATETAGTTAATQAAVPDRFRVRIGNRMYPEWSDEVTVGIGESFFLGDTEFTAAVSEYLPDFRIQEGGKPYSASDNPGNPALHVIVYREDAAVDSSWAFLNFPPHFSPTSFFTFQLLPAAEADAAGAQPAESTASASQPAEGAGEE